MKVLIGYFTVTLLGFVASQGILTLLQGPSRRLQLTQSHGLLGRSRHSLGIHDADHVNVVPRTSAHASSSASTGIAGIGLNGVLGAGGLLGGHVGLQPASLQLRRNVLSRPRTILVGQGIPGYQGMATGGASHFSPMFFDRPDPHDPSTPDTPDLVYAPRSMMGNLHHVEALRNRADADGVVFV